jgi:predicted ATPase
MAPLLTRIRIRNYRSIGEVDVSLGPLTFLIGPNGAGKSNFLDALAFVADALMRSLDQAIRERGGIDSVRRKSSGHPTNFGISLDFAFDRAGSDLTGSFAFDVAAQRNGGFAVRREFLRVVDETGVKHGYHVQEGVVTFTTITHPPAAAPDRLFLVNASGLPIFREVYHALSGIQVYSLNPDSMRELQSPDAGAILRSDGSNVASVIQRLEREMPGRKALVEEYLRRVVPEVSGVDPKVLGPKETLEFRQEMDGAKHPWRFLAASMSDGTVRALGILVALFQSGDQGHPIHVVGIEEPEVALHPAAAGVLVDALREASANIQVIVTSHSTELLDDKSIDDNELLAVVSSGGETRLGRIDDAARSALSRQLFTAGELLRMDQLRPAKAAPAARQLDLFSFDSVD